MDYKRSWLINGRLLTLFFAALQSQHKVAVTQHERFDKWHQAAGWPITWARRPSARCSAGWWARTRRTWSPASHRVRGHGAEGPSGQPVPGALQRRQAPRVALRSPVWKETGTYGVTSERTIATAHTHTTHTYAHTHTWRRTHWRHGGHGAAHSLHYKQTYTVKGCVLEPTSAMHSLIHSAHPPPPPPVEWRKGGNYNVIPPKTHDGLTDRRRCPPTR